MGKLSTEQKEKIDTFLDEIFFDVQGAPTGKVFADEYLIRMITKFLVSICTAWWSFTEVLEYIDTRRSLTDLK